MIIGGEVGLHNEGRGEVETGGGVGGASDSTDRMLALVRRATEVGLRNEGRGDVGTGGASNSTD